MMSSAIQRFPNLAGIATGTETDHVLNDLQRPIHVLAMVEAMEKNHIQWSRLHPDAKFLDEIHGDHINWLDIPANNGITIQDTEWMMEPEDDATIRGTDYLSAAVAELLDRSRAQDWSTDL